MSTLSLGNARLLNMSKYLRLFAAIFGVLAHSCCCAQLIQVFDANGTLLATYPVVAPYLHTTGLLLFQRADNTNLYATRIGNSTHWRLCDPLLPPAMTPAASVLPGYLELDGKWYRLSTAFVQAFFVPGNHSVLASASNCTAAGAPLPVAVAPKLTLNGVQIGLAPTVDIVLENLPNADVIRMQSRSGNIQCDGQVDAPVLQDAIFSSGFQ